MVPPSHHHHHCTHTHTHTHRVQLVSKVHLVHQGRGVQEGRMGRMALMAKMVPLGQLVVMDYRATLEYLYVNLSVQIFWLQDSLQTFLGVFTETRILLRLSWLSEYREILISSISTLSNCQVCSSHQSGVLYSLSNTFMLTSFKERP